MNNTGWIWITVVFWGIMLVGAVSRVDGQERDSLTGPPLRKFTHGLKFEGRPEYIFQTSSFLRGETD